MEHTQRSSPWSWIPPPLGFASAFLAGWFGQHRLWPHASTHSLPLGALGGALMGLGAVFALSAIALFFADRTTVIPHGRPSRFVARGPYRRTRNPMYVGVSFAYVGLALWTGTWLAIPLLALPLVHLSRWVIPMEETTLLGLFGESYEDYRRRVRRWL